MSVNPVTDDCSPLPMRPSRFQLQKLKAAFPEQYLDVYNYLLTGDFSTVDGPPLHGQHLSFHSLLCRKPSDCLIVGRNKKGNGTAFYQKQTVVFFLSRMPAQYSCCERYVTCNT